MKTRLNVICVLIFVVLLSSTVPYLMMVARISIDATEKVMSATRELNLDSLSQESTDSLAERIMAEMGVGNLEWADERLYVAPLWVTQDDTTALVNSLTGQRVGVQPEQMLVNVKVERGALYSTVKGLSGIVTGLAGLAVLVLFVYFVMRINRRHVFDWKNVRLLRIMGACLLVATVLSAVFGIADAALLWAQFQPHGYMIDYTRYVEFSNLVIALLALAAAEVFSIGIKLREEQELTI